CFFEYRADCKVLPGGEDGGEWNHDPKRRILTSGAKMAIVRRVQDHWRSLLVNLATAAATSGSVSKILMESPAGPTSREVRSTSRTVFVKPQSTSWPPT